MTSNGFAPLRQTAIPEIGLEEPERDNSKVSLTGGTDGRVSISSSGITLKESLSRAFDRSKRAWFRETNEERESGTDRDEVRSESELSINEGEFLFSDLADAEAIAAESHERHRLMSQSVCCRFTVSFVVFLNTLVIAAEAMYINMQLPIFDNLELGFTLFYVAEITFRLWEVGIVNYLTKLDWAWNVFDLAITALSVVDTATDFCGGGRSGASVGRLFRIFRILRMFRAMRFLNEVDYVLITAATATLKLGATVSLFIFVSAIVATNILWDCHDEMIASMFSSLGTSMWSLFKLMTLDNWIVICQKVIDEKPGMMLFFIMFIFTTSMALISLVPAIFIELTLSSKQRADKLHEELQKETARRHKEKSLRTLFKVTDVNNNGRVSLDELRNVLSDDSSIKRLREAGLTQPKELEDVRLGLFDLWETRLEKLRLLKENSDTVPVDAIEMSEEEFIASLTEHDLSQMTIWRTTTATRLMIQELCSHLGYELQEIRAEQKRARNSVDGLRAKGTREFDEFDHEIKFIRDRLEATTTDLAAMIRKSTTIENMLNSVHLEKMEKPPVATSSSSKASSVSIGFGKLAGLLGRDSPKTSPRENNLGDAKYHSQSLSLSGTLCQRPEDSVVDIVHSEQEATLQRPNLEFTEPSGLQRRYAEKNSSAALQDCKNEQWLPPAINHGVGSDMNANSGAISEEVEKTTPQLVNANTIPRIRIGL